VFEKGESCPGEEKCGDTAGKPLNRYPDEETDTVCNGCPLLKSKPERIPDELLEGVATGFHLAEIKANGAAFAYPESLTPFEWMALAALNRGRSRAQEQDRKLREQKKRK
jgi:hypothetical protein